MPLPSGLATRHLIAFGVRERIDAAPRVMRIVPHAKRPSRPVTDGTAAHLRPVVSATRHTNYLANIGQSFRKILRLEAQKAIGTSLPLVHPVHDASSISTGLICAAAVSKSAAMRSPLLPADPTRPILFSEALVGDGAKILAAADRLGLEGVVSKRAGSRYASGRSKAWLKSKNMTEGEFVVVGMEPNPNGPPFALLARQTKNGLTYAGSDSPAVRGIARREAAFVRPSLRVRAKHLKGEGLLRHASLIGLA